MSARHCSRHITKLTQYLEQPYKIDSIIIIIPILDETEAYKDYIIYPRFHTL